MWGTGKEVLKDSLLGSKDTKGQVLCTESDIGSITAESEVEILEVDGACALHVCAFSTLPIRDVSICPAT